MKVLGIVITGVILVLLSSCVVVPNNYTPDHTRISEPPLGSVRTAYVGDRLLLQGVRVEYDALLVEQDVAVANITIKKGVYLKIGEDKVSNFFTPSRAGDGGSIVVPAGVAPVTVVQAFKEINRLCIVLHDGSQGCNFGKQEGDWREENQPVVSSLASYRFIKQEVSTSDSFQQTLIYSGKIGNRINIDYREFSGDVARPAFSNDVEYDLSVSRTIGYKGAKLEVLEANNEFIRYKILRNFNTATFSSPDQSPATAVRSTGTAWLVSHGYIVTANHVIEGKSRIYVLASDGEEIPVSVKVADEANDIAILALDRVPASAAGIPLSKTAPVLGSRVFTVGFPHPTLMGTAPKMSAGEISGTTGIRDDPRHLQISVPVQSGNSGGPLVNSNGEVIGIITAKLDASAVEQVTGDLPQNVNYAIKSRYLTFLLSDLPQRTVPAVQPRPDWSIEEATREVSRAVVLIVAE